MSNQKRKKRREMSGAERVQDFQRKVYRKAKQEKGYRFYVLYDKICLMHFLEEAYRRARGNGGAPGVDGITFEDIEAMGREQYLVGIQKELIDMTYRPQPVRRRMIPKASGKMRPLGIPTIRDRVVQMTCKLVIEPVFEADFEECSYGFRPKRSAADAVCAIRMNLRSGKEAVYDADLASYFDTIPHEKLMILIASRISDKYVLRLIKMWLKTPVEENGRLTGGKKNKVGTPQGGVISPLLANIYLNLLDKVISREDGLFAKYGIKVVRYADDFVLMGRRIHDKDLNRLKMLITKMGLEINEEKSKRIHAVKESFDFLGFTFRYDKSIEYNGYYWNIHPSMKSCKKLRRNLSEYLRYTSHLPPEVQAEKLNSMIKGWLNYFSISGVSYPATAKRKLRQYLITKLRRYYRKKSQRKSKLYRRGAFWALVNQYGLQDPVQYTFETPVKV